ncbi:MAG: hypothetical protein A3J07_02190 [Candidatus Doudnabacteria bacterium RIFCSPLOWO2_02_FULL_49_13]|uniref:GIY-YIG domain-containing protein n=1 Tax=Candidatus Doudnabacteria bacterium RIFCSPHIGHO2_12_FULL_48_16 TaxID=1817838 RepID=A0A1F5PLC9_9BACT|nr:MAG: hypothetical protein A3B77_00520 [Candidatus Doudnabacteria bacterium RIFCSPHIGHO2_02_FULL_49_24]OGE90743.1 MAG: hypothetical protein A3E29_01290 [Candidatus Doudnabacteria bacterium RIFCSPHIGHO2_12_FULL_48_16]OGE97335.1 MAG: hypothetical protein A2990_04410 [Candidatus Doudnabacteria bacterium RIFCSPLOWO2_01_FULL_49_40]OGF02606.1 MAG: hypothetical protein A3J07_02190 [Candidatus Doudnabacteria bacterium RIFCSPLOWO2_02_FULL_49_13]OGF03644.1 MAG: hypothetical protein A3H14_03760 [Candida
MYYTYILYNLEPSAKRKFYVGITNDLDRRIFEHNSGQNGFTSKFGPWHLIYYEAYLSVDDAAAREKKLKHHGKGLSELKIRLENSILQAKRCGM